VIATLSGISPDVKFMPCVRILASAGQNQVDPPETVSHERQDKVSVRTEIFIGAESLIMSLAQRGNAGVKS